MVYTSIIGNANSGGADSVCPGIMCGQHVKNRSSGRGRNKPPRGIAADGGQCTQKSQYARENDMRVLVLKAHKS